MLCAEDATLFTLCQLFLYEYVQFPPRPPLCNLSISEEKTTTSDRFETLSRTVSRNCDCATVLKRVTKHSCRDVTHGDTKLKFILVQEWPELRRSRGRPAGQPASRVRWVGGLFRLEAELGEGGGGGGCSDGQDRRSSLPAVCCG